MGRTKLGGTPSSRQRYVCPVRSCKSNPRGDTWTTHWKTQVIFDDTDSGYAKDPKNVRKFCTRSERDHTQYFYDGHFSISNLPKLTIVYHNPKERVKTISDLWKKSATKRKATDTSGGESDIDEPQQDNESNEVPDSGEKKSFPQSRRNLIEINRSFMIHLQVIGAYKLKLDMFIISQVLKLLCITLAFEFSDILWRQCLCDLLDST